MGPEGPGRQPARELRPQPPPATAAGLAKATVMDWPGANATAWPTETEMGAGHQVRGEPAQFGDRQKLKAVAQQRC
jgi:hypothetical protein